MTAKPAMPAWQQAELERSKAERARRQQEEEAAEEAKRLAAHARGRKASATSESGLSFRSRRRNSSDITDHRSMHQRMLEDGGSIETKGRRKGRGVAAPVAPAKSERYGAVKAAFNKFDADGSGDIDKKEMKMAMKALGLADRAAMKKLFAEADADGGGTVDYMEFRQMICRSTFADLSARLTAATPDEETIIGTFMAGTESVLAAEHVLVYKYQLGELVLVASSTQDARTEVPLKIQAGTTLGPEQYEKAVRTCETAVLDPTKVEVKHLGGSVASLIVAPISSPGDRLLGLIEFVNVEAAFDDSEKDFASKLSQQLAKTLAVASQWGATSTPLRGVHQCPRLLKMTVSSKEESYEKIGDCVVDVCNCLQGQNPEWHLYVMFLGAIVDGERWDDRSRICDPRVAATLAPLENVMVVEVSIREEDWTKVDATFPLCNHPRWILTQLPTLCHWSATRPRLQEIKLKKLGAIENLEEFVRCTLSGGTYEARRARTSRDWTLPPPPKVDEHSSRSESRAALLEQMQLHRAASEALLKHKSRLDENIGQLEKMLAELGDASRQPSRPGSGRGSSQPNAKRKPRISFSKQQDVHQPLNGESLNGEAVNGEAASSGGEEVGEARARGEATPRPKAHMQNGNGVDSPTPPLVGGEATSSDGTVAIQDRIRVGGASADGTTSEPLPNEDGIRIVAEAEAEAERAGGAGPSAPLAVDAPPPGPAAAATSETAEALEAYAQQMVPRVAESASASAASAAPTDLEAYFKSTCPSLLEAAGAGAGGSASSDVPEGAEGAEGAGVVHAALGRALGGDGQLDEVLRAVPQEPLDAAATARFDGYVRGALQTLESRMSGEEAATAVELDEQHTPDQDAVTLTVGSGGGFATGGSKGDSFTTTNTGPDEAGSESGSQSARQRATLAAANGQPTSARKISMEAQWQNGRKPDAAAPTVPMDEKEFMKPVGSFRNGSRRPTRELTSQGSEGSAPPERLPVNEAAP